MTNLIRASLVALSLFAAGTAQADNTVVVINQSSFIIHSLYISPTASNAWGPDQLGEDVIPPGGTMTFTGITCGTYDVRLTNPEGGVCDVSAVTICSGAEPWLLTDAELLACGQ